MYILCTKYIYIYIVVNNIYVLHSATWSSLLFRRTDLASSTQTFISHFQDQIDPLFSLVVLIESHNNNTNTNTNNQQPTTNNNQQPTNNNEQPTTNNNEQPTTNNNQEPTTNNNQQPTTNNNQQPTTNNNQQPKFNNQQPTTTTTSSSSSSSSFSSSDDASCVFPAVLTLHWCFYGVVNPFPFVSITEVNHWWECAQNVSSMHSKMWLPSRVKSGRRRRWIGLPGLITNMWARGTG